MDTLVSCLTSLWTKPIYSLTERLHYSLKNSVTVYNCITQTDITQSETSVYPATWYRVSVVNQPASHSHFIPDLVQIKPVSTANYWILCVYTSQLLVSDTCCMHRKDGINVTKDIGRWQEDSGTWCKQNKASDGIWVGFIIDTKNPTNQIPVVYLKTLVRTSQKIPIETLLCVPWKRNMIKQKSFNILATHR